MSTHRSSVAAFGGDALLGDVYTGVSRVRLLPLSGVTLPGTRDAAGEPVTSSVVVPPALWLSLGSGDRPATVSFFDVSGRVVGRSRLGAGAAGQVVTLDAFPLGAGVFFARIDAAGSARTVKLQLIR